MKRIYISLLMCFLAINAIAQIEMFDESVQKVETPKILPYDSLRNISTQKYGTSQKYKYTMHHLIGQTLMYCGDPYGYHMRHPFEKGAYYRVDGILPDGRESDEQRSRQAPDGLDLPASAAVSRHHGVLRAVRACGELPVRFSRCVFRADFLVYGGCGAGAAAAGGVGCPEADSREGDTARAAVSLERPDCRPGHHRHGERHDGVGKRGFGGLSRHRSRPCPRACRHRARLLAEPPQGRKKMEGLSLHRAAAQPVASGEASRPRL